MIFLSLFAVGTAVAWLLHWLRGSHGREDVALGAAGAFLLGGLAVGLAERSVAAFDPLVLALGALGAAVAVQFDKPSRRGPRRPGGSLGSSRRRWDS